MTPQQFHFLPDPEKRAMLETKQQLAERFEPRYAILLYQMDGWLLETYWHRHAGLVQFRTITAPHQLSGYDMQIMDQQQQRRLAGATIINQAANLWEQLQHRTLHAIYNWFQLS